MAKIIKFVDANMSTASSKPKSQLELIGLFNHLSEIDEMIKNHYYRITCQPKS